MKYLAALIFTVVLFSFNKQEKQRRFFIGYTGVTQYGRTYSGGEEFGLNDFPNQKEIVDYIKQTRGLKTVYIISLYEFKSEADSKRFWQP
jgi:hypothetical protein